MFYGTEGRVNVDRGHFKFWRGSELKVNPWRIWITLNESFWGQREARVKSSNHKVDFLECVRSRKRPICDVEVGARTVSVCHLVNFAYFYGKPMKWDPKKEQFVGGTGDTAWLDVPHRSPFKLA
jgi:hypothetical protein